MLLIVLIGIFAILVRYLIWVSDGYYDTKQSGINKNIAKDREALCYKDKSGVKLTSNNKKVVVIDNKIIDPKSRKVIFDSDEDLLNRRQKYCQKICLERGYDFYPVCLPDYTKECVMRKIPVLYDVNTGKNFIFYSSSGKNWIKKYYHLKGENWVSIPGKVESIDYDLDRNINKELYNIRHNSIHKAAVNIF